MMEKVYARTKGIRDDMVVGFCPGCMHGTVFKLIGEVLEELGVLEKTITVHGVGCCGLAMEYVTYDCTTSPHGRACAVATGVKRANPDKIVFTYQGDGDLASIGLAETMSAANRGENFTVIFVNNGIYGMTGGQMAPTTLVGMKKAFQNQLDGKGFSMVEIVTSCPTNWGLDPLESLDFLEQNMLKEFPLGVIRDKSKEA